MTTFMPGLISSAYHRLALRLSYDGIASWLRIIADGLSSTIKPSSSVKALAALWR